MDNGIDIVYALGSGSKWKNNEIMYSLRSIEKYLLGWRNVFIVGVKPYGLGKFIHIQADDLLNNNADGNIARKVLLACADKRISDTFLFINDDHLFLKQIEILNIPPYNKGDLRDKDNLYYKNGGLYIQRLRRTMEILIRHKLPTLHYDCHTPILINKHKFPQIMKQFNFEDDIGYTMKSLYGNSMNFESPFRADMNIKTHLTIEQIRAVVNEYTIMAYNDSGLNTDLKQFLREKFPKQSKFEIMDKQRQVALHEAQEWLENPNKTYKEGVRIYSQLGRDKRLLAQFKQIDNTMMQDKLHKELAKLKDILLKQGVIPINPKTQAKGQNKNDISKDVKKTDVPDKINNRLKIDSNPSLDINLLPADKRNLFEQNQQLTKELTVLQEKMKVATTKEERSRLAGIICMSEDIRDNNWQILDAWWKDYTKGDEAEKITEPSGKYPKSVIDDINDPAVQALSKELRIKANLNYIKRYTDSKKPGQVSEVKLRTEELIQWGVKIN